MYLIGRNSITNSLSLGMPPDNYRIDPTFSSLPFLNSAATDPIVPVPI